MTPVKACEHGRRHPFELGREAHTIMVTLVFPGLKREGLGGRPDQKNHSREGKGGGGGGALAFVCKNSPQAVVLQTSAQVRSRRINDGWMNERGLRANQLGHTHTPMSPAGHVQQAEH